MQECAPCKFHLPTLLLNPCLSNHVQVLMLHKSIGADVYILMHKPNEKRDTWYHLTTEGTADEFAKKFPKIPEYWRKFVKAYESAYTYVCIVVNFMARNYIHSLCKCIVYYYFHTYVL